MHLHLASFITSFDFHPAGDSIAIIDKYSILEVSDVNTDEQKLQQKVGMGTLGKSNITTYYSCIDNNYILIYLDHFGLCRWSPNTGESLLFVKHQRNLLSMFDAEKKAFISQKPYEIGNGYNLENNY